MADETPQHKPSFVTDEAASAEPDKPAVAPDPGEDTADGVADSEAAAAEDFEVEDAITRAAVDGPGSQ